MFDYKRIVVKVGTNVLTTDAGALDLENLASLVRQISELKDCGHEVILVSSGAITCGASSLGMRPSNVPEEQAAAAVGQPLLMQEYGRLFQHFEKQVGQILLSGDGLLDHTRRRNAKNTIDTLLANAVVPIINENDSVAIEEICFGDNDTLAGHVAELVSANLMVLLSDVDAVYSGNPKFDGAVERLTNIKAVGEEVLSVVEEDMKNDTSRGGMRSKLLCAKSASERGIDIVIAYGRDGEILKQILAGADVGTRIHGRRV